MRVIVLCTIFVSLLAGCTQPAGKQPTDGDPVMAPIWATDFCLRYPTKPECD